MQNARNQYKNGDLSADDILSHMSKYDESLGKEVYVDFVKDESLHDIEKHKSLLTKEALFIILARVNADEKTIEISNESLISLFSDLDLTDDDYMKISQALSHGMIPELRMNLFDTLSTDDDTIMKAYLFTLFDLEMIEPAREILDNSQHDEYPYFKAYLSLRECGKHFDINLFV
jgi:hypothetical protein